jgi:hypothetical protein
MPADQGKYFGRFSPCSEHRLTKQGAKRSLSLGRVDSIQAFFDRSGISA